MDLKWIGTFEKKATVTNIEHLKTLNPSWSSLRFFQALVAQVYHTVTSTLF